MSGFGDTNITRAQMAVPPELRSHTARPFTGTSEMENYSSLHNYREILFKWRWTVFVITFLFTAGAATFSILTKPEYRATARIVIEPESEDMQTLGGVGHNTVPIDDSFLATQADVLKSDNLAWQTFQQLQLSGTDDFAKHMKHETASISQAQVTKMFEERLTINRKRDTRMVEVSFDSSKPELAALVVNKLVFNYIEYNFRTKYDATRQATAWMEQRLDELKKRVETSQRALVDYERQNSIVNVGNKESVAEQKLADLNRDLTQAQNDRMEKESISKLATSTQSQVGTIAGSTALPNLEEKDADLREQYVDALAQFGEDYPKVVRLRAQLNELQKLIDRNRKQTVDRLTNDFIASKNREMLLAAAVTKQKEEVGHFNQLLIQHNILKRDFETNQQLYDNLQQRLKDADVSAGLRATNIHVVDQAIPIPIPVRPKPVRNTATGFLAGLIVGLLVAMVRDTLDNSINGAEEVEGLLDAPALALIPSQNGIRPHTYADKYLGPPTSHALSVFKARHARQPQRVELSVLQNPNSPISEAFRALRTSVLFATRGHAPQAILITSAQPCEGKTCVSLNLAFTLAHKGCRVLLIDADFRASDIAKTLGLNNDVGLGTVLTATSNRNEVLGNCIRNFPRLNNIWVLPSGPCPSNPTELLASRGMMDLLRTVLQKFDQVIIDSPAVLPITDATILSSMVDGVVFVVENEKTSRGAVLRAFRMLTHSGGKILGVALNKVDSRGEVGGKYASHGTDAYEQPRNGHRHRHDSIIVE
jgi:succinoglycan biosynthesis transport protein ExoP